MIQFQSPIHWVGDYSPKLVIVESVEPWPDSFIHPFIH